MRSPRHPISVQFLLSCFALLLPAAATAQLTAVWANNGEDKVAREELRASSLQAVSSSVWDGSMIRLFGAGNEVVAFNLVLEAAAGSADGVSVSFDRLSGPGGARISSTPASGDEVFDWTRRPIELFFVRYLEIRGLSSDLHYETYDERHIPERFRRPWSGEGDPQPGTDWDDRPDANRHYPDIAVPLELVGAFDIETGRSQSVWVDVYIPESTPAGTYQGTVTVRQSGAVIEELPVRLEVRDFTLPDSPSAKTMLFFGYEDVANRYTGDAFPECGSAEETTNRTVRDRHFLLAHRHRISLIDENIGPCDWEFDRPRPEWIPRLDGSLFTAANGYDGPGRGVGNDVFSIGTYGSWEWQGEGQQSMRTHTDAWESWFQANSPTTERFLYLTDEPDPEDAQELAQVQQWASWIENNPGPGGDLLSFVTISATEARSRVPALDIPATWFTVGITEDWEDAVGDFEDDPSKRIFLYNGNRPAGGSFATEDDGVALRVLEWAAFKMGIDRWFFWESTYYNNFQGNTGETNVFQRAHTFGDDDAFDPVLGRTGFNYGNGDGVLFYPGTDRVYPQESYGVLGPFASLRLKHWRRGIQDVDYLTLASKVDPAATQQIVAEMVPRVLWENGVEELADPTYVLTDISWSTDPDDWEGARSALADLIEAGGGGDDDEDDDDEDTECTPGPETLCLNGGRFQVEISWRDFQGATGAGHVVPFGSDDSGLFWFFAADNWELLVKVLDGCGINDRFWVLAAATTNVEYELTVTDSQSGTEETYFNPLGTSSAAITDTDAFATCP